MDEQQKQTKTDRQPATDPNQPQESQGFYRPEPDQAEQRPRDYSPPASAEPIDATPQSSDQTITWTASQFVRHHKTSGWYVIFMLAVVIFAVLIWVATKDLVTPIVVIVAGGILAGLAASKPRQLAYQLSPRGLTVGGHHFSYNHFKSFSLVKEGGIDSIMLRPLKRFGNWTTLYFEPKDESKILDMLAHRLPHEPYRPDFMDKFLAKIRF